MEKWVKINNALSVHAQVFKAHFHLYQKFWILKMLILPLPIFFFQTIASFLFHLLTTVAPHVRTLCHQSSLFDCP